ncbi:hypothetical protein Clacol_001412 [Clathrus columnatus]|uniref:Glutamyl-tRNA(Gln) amidotransferase subunit B, mitochondrial n=1 Tax=Clathrus columnatus TaxID=1419009 RepID=A0AAV5A1C0_9AGAM|nr:hypothetical protein Clacol_001412 [Clathrus columnatus]
MAWMGSGHWSRDAMTSQLGVEANTSYSAIDAAWPGTLPKLNKSCVDLAVRTALACGANVQSFSAFDRKHYFYADLPAGYQITQKYAPLSLGGEVRISGSFGEKTIRLQQIQLEQENLKAIDLNRAGSALMELVSYPDMRSPEEAAAYVKTLQTLLRTVGSSDANMEQGSFRCDVNVSVNRPGDPFGTRCEIKNLNSVGFLITALNAEIYRHIELLDQGNQVIQETRGFDENRMITYKLRSKEDAPDYRYMPDSNLPPLILTQAYLQSIKAFLPEHPDHLRKRLVEQYGFNQQDVNVLLSIDAGRDVPFDGETGQSAVSFFEETVKGRNPKTVFNWIVNELVAQLVLHKRTFGQSPLSQAQLGDLIDLVETRKISIFINVEDCIKGTAAKDILRHILRTGAIEDIATLQANLGLMTIDVADVRMFCETAIGDFPDVAERVRQGNKKVLMKLVGAAMKLSNGRADANLVKTCLEDILIHRTI